MSRIQFSSIFLIIFLQFFANLMSMDRNEAVKKNPKLETDIAAQQKRKLQLAKKSKVDEKTSRTNNIMYLVLKQKSEDEYNKEIRELLKQGVNILNLRSYANEKKLNNLIKLIDEFERETEIKAKTALPSKSDELKTSDETSRKHANMKTIKKIIDNCEYGKISEEDTKKIEELLEKGAWFKDSLGVLLSDYAKKKNLPKIAELIENYNPFQNGRWWCFDCDLSYTYQPALCKHNSQAHKSGLIHKKKRKLSITNDYKKTEQIDLTSDERETKKLKVDLEDASGEDIEKRVKALKKLTKQRYQISKYISDLIELCFRKIISEDIAVDIIGKKIEKIKYSWWQIEKLSEEATSKKQMKINELLKKYKFPRNKNNEPFCAHCDSLLIKFRTHKCMTMGQSNEDELSIYEKRQKNTQSIWNIIKEYKIGQKPTKEDWNRVKKLLNAGVHFNAKIKGPKLTLSQYARSMQLKDFMKLIRKAYEKAEPAMLSCYKSISERQSDASLHGHKNKSKIAKDNNLKDKQDKIEDKEEKQRNIEDNVEEKEKKIESVETRARKETKIELVELDEVLEDEGCVEVKAAASPELSRRASPEQSRREFNQAEDKENKEKEAQEIKTLTKILIELIGKQEVDKIKKFMETNKKIINKILNGCDGYGLTPLAYACMTENVQIFKILQSNGANLRTNLLNYAKKFILSGKVQINSNNIYNFDVLSQIAEGIYVKGVHGNTCGIHAVKNALFGLLQLIAVRNNTDDCFMMQQGLTSISCSLNLTKSNDNLTTDALIIFRNIQRLLEIYRKSQVRQYVALNENSTPIEEIDFLTNSITAIMADTKIKYDISKNVTAIGHEIGDFADISLNFNDIIKFAYQKALAKKDRHYCHAFILAVKTDKNLSNPNHWICVLVFKDEANNLVYAQMDSLGRKDYYPEVEKLKNAFESPDDLFKKALDLFNIYKNKITDNTLLEMNPDDLEYWLSSLKIREFNKFIQSFINAFSDAAKLRNLNVLVENKDFDFDKIVGELKLALEKLLRLFGQEKLIKAIAAAFNPENVDGFVKYLNSLMMIDPLIEAIKKQLIQSENAAVVADIYSHNLNIDILLDNISRAVNTENNENLLMLVIKKGTVKLLHSLLEFGASPYLETRNNAQTSKNVYAELLPFDIANDVGGQDKATKIDLLIKYAIAFVEDKIKFRKKNKIKYIKYILETRKTEDKVEERNIDVVFKLAAQHGIYKLLRMLLAYDKSLITLCDDALPLVPADSTDRDKIIKLFVQEKAKADKSPKLSRGEPIKVYESKLKAVDQKKIEYSEMSNLKLSALAIHLSPSILSSRTFPDLESESRIAAADLANSCSSSSSSKQSTTFSSSSNGFLPTSSCTSSNKLILLPTPTVASSASSTAQESTSVPALPIVIDNRNSAMDINPDEALPISQNKGNEKNEFISVGVNAQKVEEPQHPY